MFPFDGEFAALSARYNEQSATEFERIRDFIVLHYKLTERDDTPFWRHCRDMPIPDSLAERLALFGESGFAYQGTDDLFSVNSWVFVMLGQRLMPRHFHRMGGMLGEERLRRALETLKTGIARGVAALPLHKEFLRSYCPAEKA
jgi:tryptophan halogenase